jgi:uncharacterized protein (TIGR02099 family)
MTKFFSNLLYRLWQLVAAFIILLAVAISISRLLLPYANEQKHHLESWLADRIGQAVSIGEIRTGWETLGPSIILYDVDIKEMVYIGSVRVDVKVISSLFYRNLITDNLSISGVNLNINQTEDGSLSISGMTQTVVSERTTGLDFDALQDWLQSQTSIKLLETNLLFNLRGGSSYPITISQMNYARGHEKYQLRGYSELPGENRLDFTLEADGFLTNPDTKGTLYVNTESLDLTEIPLAAFWQEAEIQDGDVSLQAWFEWQNQGFQYALASLSITDFQLALQDAPQGQLNRLETRLIWQQLDDGWQIQTEQADVTSNGRDWPAPFVQLRKQKQPADRVSYYLRSSILDVGIWGDLLLARQNLDPGLRERLFVMDPRGFLDAVNIDATFQGQELLDLNFTGRFSELSFNSYGSAPGIKNMAGQLQIQEDSGNLYLDSRYATYDSPNMFRWPLALDYINADIEWTLTDSQLDLTIQHFTAEVMGTNIRSDGNFLIGLESGDVDINLFAELTDGNMSNTRYFLPVGVMSDNLVNYLDESIISGTLTDVTAVVRGSTRDFPFTDGSGVFAIHGVVEDSTYQFQPNWPALEQMYADLWFVGNGMDIQLRSAQSMKHQINSASAIVTDFSNKPTVLQIKSDSQGELSDAPDYLANSPLADNLAPVTNALAMAGDFGLTLDMAIPLGDGDRRINGELVLSDANLVVKDIDMPATSVNGNLLINNNSVSSKNISARFLGSDSRININQTELETGVQTDIQLTGDITMASVYKVFGDYLPRGISGQTSYEALLQIPAAGDNVFSLELETRTGGIVSDIPYPLSKSAEIGLPLKLSYLAKADKRNELELTWLDKLHLMFSFNDRELTSGVIAFGTNEAQLSDRPGIEITGNIDRLNLVDWLDFLTNPQPTEGQTNAINYEDYYLNNLTIAELDYYFLDFSNTQVSGVLSESLLKFNLDGDNILGNVDVPLPVGSNSIALDLEKIVIPDLLQEAFTEQPEIEREAQADPLPALSLTCKSCLYAGQQLGPSSAVLKPLPKGNEVRIKVERDNILSMDVTGQWQETDEGVVTSVTGEVATDNLGSFLTMIHQDAGIRDTSTRINGELNWSGDPGMFNFRTLSGNLNANAGKGSQRELSDRAARLFTLFSLGSIARKLTLDFSDLFQDGFFYTGMSGNFTIDNGVFKTSDFDIRGTSADVAIRGTTDFNNNRIEQCILVTPDLGSSLPVLAGWAIEPVTGFVVFLMSKIFQPAIDVVSSIRYQVEGSFDDPIITEIGKSRARATISEEDTENPSIQVEQSEKPFNCDDQFK